MQRKAYVSGVAALLAALLAGCTGSSDSGGSTDDSNPGDAGTATATAEPGRYATLPDPCEAVDQGTLDSLLPGIKELTDEEQREQAYEGTPTVTFDTGRKAGCRWKVESADATDHLFVDFERVVSYDTAVSDDSEAEAVFATEREAADLPEPTVSESGEDAGDSPSAEASGSPAAAASRSVSPSPSASASDSSPSSSTSSAPATSPTDGTAPTELQPRILDDLGDEAFLDDALSSSGSTARQRTVTVAFRTSNVIVRIVYEEQPATVGMVPDSEEMQDRARNLASQLADALAE